MSHVLAEAGVEPAPPRILRISVRSTYNGRRASVFAKVPYGGAYALAECLTRAVMTNEITWFRIEVAPAKLITAGVREHLVRWPEALRSMSERTGVSWLI